MAETTVAERALVLGAAMRIKREELDISARALSLRCGLSGSYVGKVESGSVDPSFTHFSRLAVELDLTQAEIYALVRVAAECHTGGGE